MADGVSTRVSFKSKAGAAGELGRTQEMGFFLGEKAALVAGVARTIGPRSEEGGGERYVDQIGVDVGVEGRTLVGRVSARKFTSGWIEFGTKRTKAFAPLRRAAEAVGLRLSRGSR